MRVAAEPASTSVYYSRSPELDCPHNQARAFGYEGCPVSNRLQEPVKVGLDDDLLDPRLIKFRPDVNIIKDVQPDCVKDWLCETLESWASREGVKTFRLKIRKHYSQWIIEVYNKATLPKTPEDTSTFGFISESCMEFRIARYGSTHVEWARRCYWGAYRESFYRRLFEMAEQRWPITTTNEQPQQREGGTPGPKPHPENQWALEQLRYFGGDEKSVYSKWLAYRKSRIGPAYNTGAYDYEKPKPLFTKATGDDRHGNPKQPRRSKEEAQKDPDYWGREIQAIVDADEEGEY